MNPRKHKPEILNFTPKALAHFKHKISLQGRENKVKLGVKKMGCNGYSYNLSYLVSPSASSDAVFYNLIAVDPMTLGYLQDINIDWVEEGLNEYIKIQSPLEVAQCGCGESFTI